MQSLTPLSASVHRPSPPGTVRIPTVPPRFSYQSPVSVDWHLGGVYSFQAFMKGRKAINEIQVISVQQKNAICDIFILFRSAPPHSSATPTIAFYPSHSCLWCNATCSLKLSCILHTDGCTSYKYKTAMSISYEEWFYYCNRHTYFIWWFFIIIKYRHITVI